MIIQAFERCSALHSMSRSAALLLTALSLHVLPAMAQEAADEAAAEPKAAAEAPGQPESKSNSTTDELLLDLIPVQPLAEPAPDPVVQPKRNKPLVEEIVVTATKRDSSLQDTGIAISVLNSDDMKFRDMNNLEDMQKSVPGLNIGTILGTPLITIRGVGLNTIGGLGNPGVATHYDGIYIPRTGSSVMATVDLDRVEVLRGPQGTLYGRNANGGSINFIAKQPANEFGAGASGGFGDYERRFYEGYVEGPVFDDDLALRGYFRRDYFEGYGVNETNGHAIGGNDALTGRIAFRYQVSDLLSIYGSHSRRDDEGAYPYSTALTPVRAIGGGEYPRDEVSFEPYNIKGLRDPQAKRTTRISNLTLDWDGEDYDFKSITGYVDHWRDEYFSAPESERFVIYLERHDTSQTWSQELNLSGKWFDDRLNWLVGGYYTVDDGSTPFVTRINMDEFTGLVTTPSGSELIYEPSALTKDTSQALFIDGNWSALDNLRLVFGARISEEKREFNQTFEPYVRDTRTGNPVVSTVTQALLSTGLLLETCRDAQFEQTFSSADPKLGLEWDVREEMMAYVQYQTGFKAGGFNTSTRCGQSYKPETIASYEVGLKSTLMDGLLTLNTAAFHYEYGDYQVEKIDGFASSIENAASAKTNGLEVEATLIPSTWLTLNAQYSFLDATYDEYMARDNFKNTNVFVQDAPVEDLSGKRLSRSPRHSANLGVTLSTDIGRFGLGMARFRLEGSYTDDIYFREFNLPIEQQEAYYTFDAYLSVDSANEKLSLSFFGKNLGDERYQVGQIPFDTIKYYGAYYGPPRTIGASLSLKW